MSPPSYERDSEPTQLLPAKVLTTLLEVSSALASTLDLGDVLQITITSVTDLLEIETGAIYVLDEGDLYLGATTPPLPPGFPRELRQARLTDHPHIRQAIETKAPVYLSDARNAQLTEEERVVVETRHLVSILYFPLLLKDEAIGAFIVGTTTEPRQFSENEINICRSLSSQSSLAITNARLYEDTQNAIDEVTQAYDATLIGWSQMLDLRDHITDEHTRRVVELTLALAEKMGIPVSEFDHLRRGALLHDIGKMGIPDEILQKKGPLTEEEMAVMRTHPELGYQILSGIDFLESALEIAYCHHEKWDGNGYPLGLHGEDIPLSARIFAVVDVWDALTSDRPYRPAWDEERALAYIRDQAGEYFDPAVVAVFLDMME